MPGEGDQGERACYRPKCRRAPRWLVTDTASTHERLTCDEHMPRAVVRTLRGAAADEPVVVSPLFVFSTPLDVVPLLAIGANVYGMVNDPTAASIVDSMADEVRQAAEAALRSAGRAVVIVGGHGGLVAGQGGGGGGQGIVTPREALSGPGSDQADAGDVIPFPDSVERYEGPDDVEVDE